MFIKYHKAPHPGLEIEHNCFPKIKIDRAYHAAKGTKLLVSIVYKPDWFAVVDELIEVALQGKDLSWSCCSDLVPHISSLSAN